MIICRPNGGKVWTICSPYCRKLVAAVSPALLYLGFVLVFELTIFDLRLVDSCSSAVVAVSPAF
jgi:hypothetical protein